MFLGQFADDVTCAGFRDRLKKQGLSGLEGAASATSEGVRHGEKSLSVTLAPTLERLGEPERLALAYAALLPPDHVPLPWLRALMAERFPELGRDAEPGYPDPWQTLARRLFSLRLLQATGVRGPDGGPLVARMHRLVQELVRRGEDAGANDLEPAVLAYIKGRSEFLRDGWVAHEHRWELGPLEACAWQWLERDSTDGAYLANQAAGPLMDLGKFAEAEPLLRRALAIYESVLDRDHPDTLTTRHDVASWTGAAGDARRALQLLTALLPDEERVLGHDHPSTLTTRHDVALWTGAAGDARGRCDSPPRCCRTRSGCWAATTPPRSTTAASSRP